MDFTDYTFEQAQKLDKEALMKSFGLPVSKAKMAVLNAAFSQPGLLPTLRIRKKVTLAEYLGKWSSAYEKGYSSRPSKRIAEKSKTIPDAVVKFILTEFYGLDDEDATSIELGHSAMMSIENMTGDMLEEYLSSELGSLGWHCAWGATITAVDFTNDKGELLQVKNSDNSENSSSSKIRKGTKIEKWFRRFSTKKDTYNWAEIQRITGCKTLNEDSFRKFIKNIIKNNKNLLSGDLE